MKTRFFIPCSLFLAGLCAPFSQAAEFLPITSVTSSTEATDLYPAGNLIQGAVAGYADTEPHDAVAPTAGTLWVTDAPGGAADYYETTGVAPVLIFDLGSDVQLGEISTWGYSDGNSNGVKDFTLRFATEAEGIAGFGTSISYNPTFPCALAPLTRDSHPFSENVTARYVEFVGFDNYGGEGLPGGDRVGLGEVAFENVIPPDDPTISVPAEIALALTSSVITEDITVANKGLAALTITGTNFTGPNLAAFSATIVPASIAATSSDTLQIQFDPAGLEGPISATLEIMSNDPNTPTAEILFTGTVPPAAQNIIVSDPIVDRTVAAVKTIVIPVENDGGVALVISGTSLSGDGAFSILTSPPGVDPVSTSNIEVQVDPTGLEGLLSTTLTILSDDPETPMVDVLIEAVALGDAATFYPIDAVTSSTAGDDLWPVSNLIQGPGNGYDANTPYTKLIDGADGNWVTAACGFPCDYVEVTGMPTLLFDLGEDVALGEISLWGYAATNSNGISEFSLRFATSADGEAGLGTSITYNPTFGGIDSGEFPNLDNTSRFSFPFSEAVSARFVEILTLDNHFVAPGDGSGGEIPGGDRVGLGEVAFSILSNLPQDDFSITQIELVDGNVEFEFKSKPGRTYGIFRSTDLGISNGWEELDDSYPSGGDLTTFLDDNVPEGATRVYYEVRPGVG